MRILEAREGFIKIETEKEVMLSSFLKICDTDKSYVAQVIKTQKMNNLSFVYAKILYLFNETFETYDGSLPQLNTEISIFDADKLLKTFVYNEPILVGKLAEKMNNIIIDKSCFDKKTLVCVDTPKFSEVISSNLKQELSKTSKTLVIDMQGVIPSQKFVAGKDFRLPLNTESLEFMYEDCLNDATSDSKNLIKDIFKDLSDYSKTVQFLPFGALKTIVDDMVDNSHVFKLLVLKNKLNKFDKMGYFALTQAEAENLSKILAMKSAVVDLSNLDVIFQNRYLETIYKNLDDNTNVIVIASNNISKKNLKTVLTKQNIASTFVTHSRFKFINEIKSMFKNFIIEPSFANNENFKQYVALLNNMPKETYLMFGEGTNYLPLISVLERFPEEVLIEENEIDEEIFEEIVETEVEEASDFDTEVEKDEQTKAIDKKSEELIEKISADIEKPNQSGLALFEDESDEDDDVVEDEADESGAEEEEVAVDLEGEKEEYHTEVDEVQTLEVSEEILDMTDDAEEGVNTEVSEDDCKEVSEYEPLAEENAENEIEFDLDDEIEIVEVEEDVSEAEQVIENSQIVENVDAEESVEETVEPEIVEQNLEVEPLDDDNLDEITEIVELDDSVIDESDIIVEIEDDILDTEETLDKEIIEDVDKVFTTLKDNTLSDSDLDLIDELNNESIDEGLEVIETAQEDEDELDFVEPLVELNSDADELEEEKEILETKKSSTTNVPVYDAEIPAEDTVLSDPIEQGDTVTHAKYGVGVVEKMIKYGNKTLFSINFDNVGRRLLDPTLTEIKKS